jgi:hypothetical protein
MLHYAMYTSYSLYFDGSEMTAEDTEFLLAIASYQKRFHRRYPTWLEVLNVLRCLGYRKVAEPVPIDEPKPPSTVVAPQSEYELMKAKFEEAKSEPP